MSTSWSQAGNLLATSAKDKKIRVMDLRTKEVVATAVGHQNTKDSRVLWLGESHFVLTSGFDSVRKHRPTSLFSDNVAVFLFSFFYIAHAI
jgi:WD40 repeat protein